MQKNKEKKENQTGHYPKRSYTGIMKKIFWIGFLGIFVMSLFSNMRTLNFNTRMQSMQKQLSEQKKKLETIPVVPETEKENIIVNENGAKVFAANFAKEYYTWNYAEDKNEERLKRLQPYLASGIVGTAGYDITQLPTASKVSTSEVWSIQVSDSYIDVVVKVKYVLTEQVKNKKKTTDEVVGQEERYLNVPLVTNGEGFKVRDLPYLIKTSVDMDYVYQTEQTNPDTIITDETILNEVTSFMETFFKIATTGTKEELAYYTKTEMENLQGIYDFKTVDKGTAYQQDNGYRVFFDVWMQDVTTKADVLLKVSCTLVKEDARFVVADIEY